MTMRGNHEWKRFGFDVPLEIIHSRYRDLVAPVESYLDELDQRWHNDTITIIIPEVSRERGAWSNLLHGQSALALKLALLDRADTVVTSVPFVPTTPATAADASSDTPKIDAAVPTSGPPILADGHHPLRGEVHDA